MVESRQALRKGGRVGLCSGAMVSGEHVRSTAPPAVPITDLGSLLVIYRMASLSRFRSAPHSHPGPPGVRWRRGDSNSGG